MRNVGSRRVLNKGGWKDVAVVDSDFDWLPFTIQRRGSKFRAKNFDLFRYANKTGTHYYVDVNNGSNGNDGLSWATAKQDIWNVAAAAGENDIIHIAEGIYWYGPDAGGASEGGYQGSPDCCMIGHGDVILTSCYRTSYRVWTKVDNHYESDSFTMDEGLRTIWDRTSTETDGSYTELTARENVNDVDSNAGSWYFDADANTIYIRTHDDRAPDDYLMIAGDGRSGCSMATSAADKTYYLENIKFMFSGYRHLRAYTLADYTLKILVKNCTFSHSGYTYGLVDLDGCFSIFEDCTFEHSVNAGDGIDYEQIQSSPDPKGIEINCRFNNIRGQSNDQCSTYHDASKIVRIGGEYSNSEAQVIAEDDEGGKAWLLGCILHDSDSGYGYWGADAWLDRCYIYNCSNYGIKSVGTVRTRKCYVPDGTDGTVEEY